MSSSSNSTKTVALIKPSSQSQQYMNNFKNIIQSGNEPCMTKEYKPKFAQQFDKYLTPDELKKHVLHSATIQKLIDFYSSKTGEKRKSIEKKIKEILDEIGLARNLAIIRWCGMCITAVSKRICSGIYVNEKSLNKVKAGLGKNAVLYLPSHRSYCDFILMSYICFHYEIEIPGIAAGMDFHAMVGMGTMLRKTGAFFMRRSFSGDEMYWDVFREYMNALMSVYHIGVEFFIEGTRSRNFKALVPKIGLLSMALEPLFMGEISDVTIVPVSVSYERLLEEKLFVYELLGIPKPKESTKGFFKALKIIEQRFGRMYLDFGDPISVKDYFGDRLQRTKYSNVAPSLQKLDRTDINLIKELANEVVFLQQERIVITTFNLIALYYAYRSLLGLHTNLEHLCKGVILLKEFFEYMGAHIATDDKSLKIEILETIEVHSNIMHLPHGHLKLKSSDINMNLIDSKRLKGHAISQTIMEMSVPILNVQIYINACLYWLSSPALIILSVKKLTNDFGQNMINKNDIKSHFDQLCNIFSNEFVIIPGKKDKDFEKKFNILAQYKILEEHRNGNSDLKIAFNSNEISDIILSSIAPFLCMYLRLTETVLNEFSNKPFTEKELLLSTQIYVEALLTNRSKYSHPYCLALDNLSVALSSLIQNSYLEKIKNNTDNSFQYICHTEKLQILHNILFEYCKILPFIYSFTDVNILAKL